MPLSTFQWREVAEREWKSSRRRGVYRELRRTQTTQMRQRVSSVARPRQSHPFVNKLDAKVRPICAENKTDQVKNEVKYIIG